MALIDLLLDYGAQLLSDHQGKTPLDAAAEAGNVCAVLTMLRRRP
jgi:ankyrin repeat protein